jgi:adenylate cyclase, class 2
LRASPFSFVPTETEIKLRVTDAIAVRKRIDQLGYTVKIPRTLESDQLYDRADQALRQSDQILRLRTRGSRSTLTYKGPAERAPHKSREELEVDISDGSTFVRILEALGYQPTFRYQKFRTTFASSLASGGQSGLITLDETPIGEFLELEGEADWIDKTAVRLEFSANDYVTASYAALYRDYCLKNPSAVPSAMVF